MNVFCVLLLFLIPSLVYGQNASERLTETGFENIREVCCDDTVYASIEDPTYRGVFRGPGVVLNVLRSVYPSANVFNLVIKEDNKGRVAIEAINDDGAWSVDVSYDSRLIEKKLDDLCGDDMQSKSYGKINIIMYPIVSLDNHLLYKLFSYGVLIAPSVETTLWKGNHVVLQPIIPLFNNYDFFEETANRHVQIGSLNIQQDFTANAKWWGRLSAGFFHYNYLGLNLEAGRHFTKAFDCGVELSLARWQDMNSGVLKIADDNLFGALLKMNYYHSETSLDLGLTMGRFLYGDYGVRGDLGCRFGEYFIGVYATLTGGEHNAGFNFSIPMSGKKQKRMGFVSVRIPESFDWEYSMSSNFDWKDKNCGKTVEVKAAKDKAAHYWEADYIKEYLKKFLNGEVD